MQYDYYQDNNGYGYNYYNAAPAYNSYSYTPQPAMTEVNIQYIEEDYVRPMTEEEAIVVGIVVIAFIIILFVSELVIFIKKMLNSRKIRSPTTATASNARTSSTYNSESSYSNYKPEKSAYASEYDYTSNSPNYNPTAPMEESNSSYPNCPPPPYSSVWDGPSHGSNAEKSFAYTDMPQTSTTFTPPAPGFRPMGFPTHAFPATGPAPIPTVRVAVPPVRPMAPTGRRIVNVSTKVPVGTKLNVNIVKKPTHAARSRSDLKSAVNGASLIGGYAFSRVNKAFCSDSVEE
ncbi:uncharacterized protein NEMAJ01_1079 [Nematocida major]|uniref:uncharacterized protein n=1 Tax=Nematocida major TaxID=1912982 RepID=UPI0020078C2D|nr:uncharacterized protein NEMAJ01_1079 [Nematocida major]KAH9386183.1 hypothetical protein NEMAJ01_1079 [Nematocida major]